MCRVNFNIVMVMAKLSGKPFKIYQIAINRYKVPEDQYTMLSDYIKYFDDHDPSRSGKYIEIMLHLLYTQDGTTPESIVNLICNFDSVLYKIGHKIFKTKRDISILSEAIKQNPKDIQQYKTYEQFELVYALAVEYDSKNDKKNIIIEEETDVVYDQEDYLIVVPLSFASSCFWGVETKWCTTSKDNPQYYENYTNDGTLFYIIDKYRQNEKSHPLSKFAIHIKNNQQDYNAEIYNRPDTSMGQGMSRMLPDRIIKILMEYHKHGAIINLDDVIKLFYEFESCFVKLPDFISDNWEKTKFKKNKEGGGTFYFSCKEFPSYLCVIHFTFNSIDNTNVIYVNWINSDNDLNIVSLRSSISGHDLCKSNKGKQLPNLWMTTINRLLNDSYNKAKGEIFRDIVFNYFKKPYKNWQFSIINSHKSKNKSLTDLGVFYFNIIGDYFDLSKYTLSAALNFDDNIFVMFGGQTDYLTWEDDFDDFNLLYFTETGLVGLLAEFQNWVINTMITKSENIIIDIYQDSAIKITKQETAFDEYLNDPTEKPKKIIKPKKMELIKPIKTAKKEKTIEEKTIEDWLSDFAADIIPF